MILKMFLVTVVKRTYHQVARLCWLTRAKCNPPAPLENQCSSLQAGDDQSTLLSNASTNAKLLFGSATLSGCTINIFQAPTGLKQSSGSQELSKEAVSEVFSNFWTGSVTVYFACYLPAGWLSYYFSKNSFHTSIKHCSHLVKAPLTPVYSMVHKRGRIWLCVWLLWSAHTRWHKSHVSHEWFVDKWHISCEWSLEEGLKGLPWITHGKCHCLGYIILTYDYCGVILHIRTVHYNPSCNVGALKIAQYTAVVSSAL